MSKAVFDSCADLAPAGLPYLGYRSNGTNTVACYYGPVPVYSCPAGGHLVGQQLHCAEHAGGHHQRVLVRLGHPVRQQLHHHQHASCCGELQLPRGQTLSGSTCSSSSTTTTPGTPIYSCPAGYTLSGSSCNLQGTATMAATANYSCASGTLSGSTCTGALSRTRFEPYGATAAGAIPGGNGLTSIGFTGHVNDADRLLVYMQRRYYDPIAARFLSVDPIMTDANTEKAFGRFGEPTQISGCASGVRAVRPVAPGGDCARLSSYDANANVYREPTWDTHEGG